MQQALQHRMSLFLLIVFLNLLMSCVKYLQCLFLKSEAFVFHFISVRLKGMLDHVTDIVICVVDKSDASFSVINSCKGLL